MPLMTHPPGRRPTAALLATLAVLALLVGSLAVATGPAGAAGALLSEGRPVTASSTENAATAAGNAVDGNPGSRWASAFADPQWLQVDLGGTAAIDQVSLRWEAAYARSFQIQVAAAATGPWTTVWATTTGTGGTQTLALTGTGRYVRVNGTARGTPYGYSLWEFQVFGTVGAVACTAANAAQGRPATAFSSESAGTGPELAVDGNAGTRWSSAFGDPQWLQVDLGASVPVCGVTLSWEAAYARSFQIQVSGSATGPWTTVYSTATGTGGTQVLPVSGTGRYVRVDGTQRGTSYGYSLWELAVRTTTGGPTIPPTTTPPTDPAGFWGDTSTIPAARNVVMLKVLNRTNDRYPDSQVYWSFDGQVHSIAEQPYLDLPANSAGRMYFHLGSPSSPYYDFIEFTVGPAVFNGNTTRVDAFGLKLAMRLHARDGYDVSVGEDQATFAEDRAVTFQRFVDEMPAEFDVLARSQAPYRIPAPGNDPAFRPGGVSANYFTAYAASVGVSATTADVTGCAGVLAENPGMCSALNRHVAQLPQSQWSDPSRFYLAGPANYYAKFWHDHSIGRLAYGFPYDDYASQSSFVSHGDPQYLLVAVGW